MKLNKKILKQIIKEELQNLKEFDFEKVVIPSKVKRFLNKFVDSMKDADLNRIRRSAILYKVIQASGMSTKTLMQDIQKIKQGLKKNEVSEGKLTEATDSYVVWSPLLNKVYDGPVSEKKALMLIKKYAKQGQYHVGMLGTKYFNKTKLGKKNPVKEGKLTEQKFKKVILPNDMKTKVKVSKMIKQLKLKIDKDYDVKALKARGGDQVISILPKHYNKFIELAMQNKLNPRG